MTVRYMNASSDRPDCPLVSVVLSFRNEEEVIPELVSRLQKVLRALPVRYELIFVNDVSTDRSLPLLLQARESDPNIKILNTARRCGVSECVLAGLEYASGDAAVIMDADLQDPPEVIPELIARWREGADVVYTVRLSRSGESALKMWLTRQAYRLIRWVSEVDLPVEAGDFKLLSRRVVGELLKLKDEKDLYLRGLVTWLGFKQVPVMYHRQPRAAGQTHFALFRTKNPLKTFLSGLTSFSLLPLQLFLLAGLLAFPLGWVCLIVLIVQVCAGVAVPTWWAVMAVVAFLASLQLAGIGVLALYLGRIYNQVKGRPNYIIESQVGFERSVSPPPQGN